MNFPKEIQRYIYTTNWIERLSRKYRRTISMRTAIPSARAAIFHMESKLWRKRRMYTKEKYTNSNAGI
uniref:transposase n=1 Tax=Prevotella dentasini TaxID=589537 RepID=UPI001F41BF1A|nr:transposase [Prevotella dentasini]